MDNDNPPDHNNPPSVSKLSLGPEMQLTPQGRLSWVST